MNTLPVVHTIAELMMDCNATVEQIGEVGVWLFVIVFGGKQSDSLNTLRYAKHMEMVASAKNIDPQKLRATARAAHYHSFCVHLQVILWKELTTDSLDPLIWAWKLDNSKLQLIMTDLEPAPESLLKFVGCKCKLSTANPYSSNTCSCCKHGLKCVTACGDCRGTTIVMSILFQNSCDSYLFASITILFYFHTTKIAISNVFLMSKFFQDTAILGHFENSRCPKTKLGIKSFPKEDFGYVIL